MTLLTPAECREIAERKMVEAEGDPVHGKEFRATAHAWLVRLNPCRSHRPERSPPIRARPATNSCPRPASRIGNTRPGPIGLARVYSGEIDRLFLAPPPF